MKEDKKAIILNKIFEGSWNTIAGNISHEIIDFVLTDNGKQYIYNTPGGHCPEWIYIEGAARQLPQETHKVQYMLLTSVAKGGEFDILYCIELEKKLHRYSNSKKDLEKIRKDIIDSIIIENEIKYGGKYLHDIYGKNDESLLVTFKAKAIKQAKKIIHVDGLKYNFQRNKGYITSDGVTANDYKKIENLIKDSSLWDTFTLNKISGGAVNNTKKSTFLDLIMKKESEELYTNILYSVLSHDDLLEKFCQQFKKKTEALDTSAKYNVNRETKIVDGRMDICASNGVQNIVIENKILSGLNGIKKNSTTQLSTYYNGFACKAQRTPLCFIVAPNSRKNEIDTEIGQYDPTIKGKYNFVGYKELADFLRANMQSLKQPSYQYNKYADDFPDIFDEYGYGTKQELYANMFLAAIQD